MDIDKVIRDQVSKSQPSGRFVFPELIAAIHHARWSGIAVSETREGESFLLFLGGEPEGALLSDYRGILVGDKAVFGMDPKGSYIFYRISPDIVDRLVLWCRIFDKSHVKPGSASKIEQIGKSRAGIGILVIIVEKGGVRIPGAHLSIRKDGLVTGKNVTDYEGKASFRLMYGSYDCALTLKDQTRLYSFIFSPQHPCMVFEISDQDTVLQGL